MLTKLFWDVRKQPWEYVIYNGKYVIYNGKYGIDKSLERVCQVTFAHIL